MSAPALAGRPSLTIRGTQYPVLLPTVRDPRLHLAAVIVTLQVLGQTAFGFNLSIAQILVALGTCAVLEVGIAFFRHHLILWPASALLTGNGVAFILRVPGTEHGDWWSLHGAWIFAGTAAIALLSKHVIRVHGRHVFNPSNFGLVVCFLALGKFRADPLDFWWGPMSPWMALALCVIVVGGFAILTRLRLLAIAVGFWLTFAAGMALLAVSGHSMTARWHVGPITGWDFWWLLVTSPEILIFLFFMITDPKTIPDGRRGRLAYAVGVGLLATLLIAPQTTEFATKVAVLTALALVCAARGARRARRREATLDAARGRRPRRLVVGTAALAGALAYAGLVVAAGIPARPEPGLTSASPTCRACRPSRSSTPAASPESTTLGASDRPRCRRRSPHGVRRPAHPEPRARGGRRQRARGSPRCGSASGAPRDGRPSSRRTSSSASSSRCAEARTRGRPTVVAAHHRARCHLHVCAGRRRPAGQPGRAQTASGGRWSSRSSDGRYVVVGSAGGGAPARHRPRPRRVHRPRSADRTRERRQQRRARLHARARSASASRTT